jgi:hypothetical protein
VFDCETEGTLNSEKRSAFGAQGGCGVAGKAVAVHIEQPGRA